MIDFASKIKYYDEDPASTRWKVLVYGETKCGKTYLAGTFPKPFIIDSDGSLAGLPPEHKHIPVLKLSRTDILNGVLKPFSLVQDTLLCLRDKKPPFDTIQVETLVIDGLTSLADMFLDEVMLDPRIGDKKRDPHYTKATFDEYGTLKARFESILMQVDDLDIHVYATCGLKIDKDEAAGYMRGMPDIVGSSRTSVGHRFDAVLRLEKIGAKPVACTAETNKFNAGTRNWIGPEKIEYPTYEKIFGDPKNFATK